jgi:MFS family permease
MDSSLGNSTSHLRNESEPSAHGFWAESSDKGISAQYFRSIIQRNYQLGRVSSIDMMGSLCLTPVGFALGGIVTDHIGPRLVFIGCGLISALLPALALTVLGVRQLD